MKDLRPIATLLCLSILSLQQDVPYLFSGSRTVYSQFSSGPQHGVPVFFSQTANILPTEYEVASAVTTIYNYEPTKGVYFGVNCIKLVSNLYCVVSMDNRVQWNRFTFNFFVSARQDLRCGTFNKVFYTNGSHQIYQPLPTPWNGQNQIPQFLVLIPFIAGITTQDRNFGVKITQRNFQLNIEMMSIKINIAQLNASEVLLDFSYLLLQLSSSYQVQNDIDLDYFQTDLDEFNGISEINFLPQNNSQIISGNTDTGRNFISLGSNLIPNLGQRIVIPTSRVGTVANQQLTTPQIQNTDNIVNTVSPSSINSLDNIANLISQIRPQAKISFPNLISIQNDSNFGIKNSQIVPPNICFTQTISQSKQLFSPQDASRFRSFFRVSGLVFKINQFEVARSVVSNQVLSFSPPSFDFCRSRGGNYVASFQPFLINETFQFISKSLKRQKITTQKLTYRCIVCPKNQQFSQSKKTCVTRLQQRLVIRNPVPLLKNYPITKFGSVFIYQPQIDQYNVLQAQVYRA